MGVVIRNRHAYKNFEIIDKIEAGIKLLGYEVKAIKEGRGHLTGSYIKFKGHEAYLIGVNIPMYSKSSLTFDFRPFRDRKLLLHKKEAQKLALGQNAKKYTLIPLKIYVNRGKIKVEVGVAKGKNKHVLKGDLIRKQQERQDKRLFKETARS